MLQKFGGNYYKSLKCFWGENQLLPPQNGKNSSPVMVSFW